MQEKREDEEGGCGMIFDRVENAKRYLGISENLDRAFKYMMETDLSALEDRRHEIDGENVFVNVMHAATKADMGEYEFHEKYYDIQIDLEGNEDILFGTKYQEITKPYQEDNDAGMGICQCEALCHLGAGKFAVCEPLEPHLPGRAADGREQEIRKAVIKVHK